MIDQILWALGGTLIGGGSIKGMTAYLSYRANGPKEPELTEEQKLVLAIESPLTEPEKTLPEHCDLFIERIFERRLVEAGVIPKEDMSVCMDGRNCVECRETFEHRERIEKAKRQIERDKKQAEIDRLSKERREREYKERMAKYNAEKWQAVMSETGKVTGHIRAHENGDYAYESIETGKRKVISAAESRRFCKTCWSPLTSRITKYDYCKRGCHQPIPKDRKRVLSGCTVSVPEEVPFDAYGEIDRTYTSEFYVAATWKFINAGNGKTMQVRSLHPKAGHEGRVPSAAERAQLNRPKATPRAMANRVDAGNMREAARKSKNYEEYKRSIEHLERNIERLEKNKW